MNCCCGNPAKVLVDGKPICWTCFYKLRGKDMTWYSWSDEK